MLTISYDKYYFEIIFESSKCRITFSPGDIQCFLIYSLTYMLVINLLMIIKRMFRVIDADMKK